MRALRGNWPVFGYSGAYGRTAPTATERFKNRMPLQVLANTARFMFRNLEDELSVVRRYDAGKLNQLQTGWIPLAVKVWRADQRRGHGVDECSLEDESMKYSWHASRDTRSSIPQLQTLTETISTSSISSSCPRALSASASRAKYTGSSSTSSKCASYQQETHIQNETPSKNGLQ